MRDQISKWSSTYVWILGCSGPLCTGSAAPPAASFSTTATAFPSTAAAAVGATKSEVGVLGLGVEVPDLGLGRAGGCRACAWAGVSSPLFANFRDAWMRRNHRETIIINGTALVV